MNVTLSQGRAAWWHIVASAGMHIRAGTEALVAAKWKDEGMHERLAIALAVLTGLLLGVAAVGLVAAPAAMSFVALAIGVAVGPLAAGLGIVVVRRAEASTVGVLLVWVGTTTAATVARETVFRWLAEHPERIDGLVWPIGLTSQIAWFTLTSVALLLLYFPDGKLPSPRWKWGPPVLGAGSVIGVIEGAAEPITGALGSVPPPLAPAPEWWRNVAGVSFVITLGLVVASLASLVLRYRRSDPVRRAQIKWLALGAAGVTSFPLMCLIEIALFGDPRWLSAVVGMVGLVGVPVSVGIAMLRHDLYDVDKAISSAVAWVLLSLGLVTVYTVVTAVAGALLSRQSVPIAVMATALAAVAFNPLRRGSQQWADTRFRPLRRAAAESVARLHRESAAGTAEPEQLEDVLRAALRDPGLRVGYRVHGEDRWVDRDGTDVAATAGVPIELGGTPIGVIVPGPDGPSPELLRDVAQIATTAAEVVRLRMEVARALHEVAASRTRLLQISYEERRRLERDLHDGAQQRLVALGMSLRVAQRHLPDGDAGVAALLDQAVAELATAVAELRQIGHGLRPSALDDGLAVALARLVRNLPMPIDMEVDDAPLPDDIATTAYFVIAEAVTNAIKHADASRIILRVSRTGDQIHLRVSDDGRGGAVVLPTSALSDRVAALGGQLAVRSPLGAGTTLEVALPCAS